MAERRSTISSRSNPLVDASESNTKPAYELSEQQKLRLEWYREYSRRYYQQHREQVLARTKEYHRIRRLQAKVLKEISECRRNNNNDDVDVDSKSMDMVSTAPT